MDELKYFEKLRYSGDDPERYGCAAGAIFARDYERSARLKLLTDAVRVVPDLLPEVFQVVSTAAERLGLSEGIDAYVYPDMQHQASSVRGGDGRPAIMLSSGIIKLLTSEELAFVVGHEVGHHVFGHHCYPDPDSIDGEVTRLNYFELKRAAEISADRIGSICCTSQEESFRAILKSATGLSGEHLNFAPGALIDQMREIESLGGADHSVASSHPMFPIRMRALFLFDMSEMGHEWRKTGKKASITSLEMDRRISRDLEKAGGGLLSRLRARSLEMAEVWTVVRAALHDNRFTKEEQNALSEIFGPERAKSAIEFLRKNGKEAGLSKFEESMKDIKAHPLTDRTQFVSDLTNRLERHPTFKQDIAKIIAMVRDRLSIS